ncbi:MAG TPA: alpha-E domain-containing protein [Stellaceae bacterium]|nr:alpha-E domain-containing protein [Stellaceae bacterium]
MLSRTADSLYWLARYVERAENTARTVLVGHWMASMARSLGNPGNEWESTLIASGCAPGYRAKYAKVTPASVVDYLVRDPENLSSLISCIETARRNARAVRTALTADMWNALNETCLQMRQKLASGFTPDQVSEMLEWVKQRSQLFNGSYANTMLRNDAYYFTRLGTYIERADNTARILDVKYHVLLPQDAGVGGALDYYQWQSILRSVSGLRSYHWVYHERLQHWRVAELLILRSEMPRSLVSCYDEIARTLDLLAEAYAGKRGECHRLAGEVFARLRYGRIQDIFQQGLHEFLTEFINRTMILGDEIASLYLI